MSGFQKLPDRISGLPGWFKDICAFAVIFFAALVVARPLLTTELIAHEDIHSTLIRAVGVAHVWQDGQWIGRWLPDINLGYGYPLLNFYAPLFSYLAAIFAWIVRDHVLGMNLVLALGVLASGWVMYLLARDHWGRWGGLLSAVAYLLIPYHACEIYRRAAPAESLVFVFIPLIIWRMYRLLQQRDRSSFVWAVASLAGLILCHNIMTVIFFPIAGLYVLFLCALDPVDLLKKLSLAALAVISTLGMTAFFWMPALAEKQYVMINKIYDGAWDFHHHFMTFQQFIFSPWEAGGISWTNGFSFQLGVVQFLFGLLALGAVVLWRRAGRVRMWHFLFWFVVGVALAFMTLNVSVKVWELLPFAKYVQYPWRLFLPLTFILAFLMGGCVFWGRGLWRIGIVVFSLALIMVLNGSFSAMGKTRVVDIQNRHDFLFNARPMDNMEYLPRWVKSIPMVPPAQPCEVLQGTARVMRYNKFSGVHHELQIAALTPAAVCFHHFYFPGWKVFIDGNEADIHPDNPYGVILFSVDAGQHEVKIVFTRTRVRVLAETVSLVFLIAFTVVIFYRREYFRGLERTHR